MSVVFKRTIEDFICGHCGATVTGSGFTNHCPHCLWSKHVDINPGDRASECNGMMDAVSVEIKHGESILTHLCVVCGYQKRNKTAENDSEDEIIRIMKHH